jgi:hypothetical protein
MKILQYAWLCALLLTAAIKADQLDIRTFSFGSNIWVLTPEGLLTYTNETRSVKRAPLNEIGDSDSIADLIDFEGTLWVSSSTGLYKIDMATQTRERVPFPGDVVHCGKIASDADYIWVAGQDSVWRYDKLGNEWLSYAMEESGGREPIIGLYSNGDELFCATGAGMRLFSSRNEKWYFYPVNGARIAPTARYFIDNDALIFVYDTKIARYIFNAKSWDIIDFKEPIIDITRTAKETLVLTSSHVYLYSIEKSFFKPLDIFGLQSPSAVGRRQDTLVYVVMPQKIIEYNTTLKTMNFFKPPAGMETMVAQKIISTADPYIVLFTDALGVFFKSNGMVWETTPLAAIKGGSKRISWDDNGLVARWSKGIETSVLGQVGINNLGIETKWPFEVDASVSRIDTFRIDGVLDSTLHFRYDTLYPNDSLKFLYYMGDPKASPPFNMLDRANVAVHTTLPEKRYVDISFNNANINRVPTKGIYYRGNPEDRLHSIQIGTNEFQAPQSQTLPATRFEGGQVIVESKKKIESRNRKVIRSTTGYGARMTTTRYEVLSYNPDMAYSVPLPEGTIIVPGSVKLTVDGNLVDIGDYGFAYDIGVFNIRRLDLLDPSSVIGVQYDIQTVREGFPSGGWDDVEFVPSHSNGLMGYQFVGVSPAKWLTPTLGYCFAEQDSLYSIFNATLPLEFRDSRYMLKLTPEYSFNPSNRSQASGVTLQSRLGSRFGLSANGLLADNHFKTTNYLSRGYGAINKQLGFTANFDVLKEIPLSYTQEHVRADRGTEDRYQFTAGAHFPRFPFLDVTLSHNVIDAEFLRTIQKVSKDIDTISRFLQLDSTYTDTIDQIKDKFAIRLFQTNSTIAQRLFHFQKMSYEISSTHFVPDFFTKTATPKAVGNIFYSRLTVTPINGLTFSPTILQRTNPGIQPRRELQPKFYFQTIDVPRGFEISGQFDWGYKNFTPTDSLIKPITDSLNPPHFDSTYFSINRTLLGTIKPGYWWSGLSWVSLLVGFQQTAAGIFPFEDADANDVFSNKHFRRTNVTSRIYGFNFYPSEQILFKNDNRVSTAGIKPYNRFSDYVKGSPDDSVTLYSLNNLQFWIGPNQDLWQTLWIYSHKIQAQKLSNNLNTLYERRWSGILNTQTGIELSSEKYYDTLSIYDSLGGSTLDTIGFTKSKFAPTVRLTLSTKEFWVIRKLLNSNGLSVGWNTINGIGQGYPEIKYSMVLDLLFKPNISFKTTTILALSRGRLEMFNFNLRLMTNF